MTTSSSPSERKYLKIRDQLAEWLRAGNFEVARMEHEKNHLWALIATAGATPMAVSQAASHPDRVGFSGTIELAERHRLKIEALSDEERIDLLWDIRLRLLSFDVDFTVDQWLREVTITKELFADSLNRSAVLTAARQVLSALRTYLACVGRRAGDAMEHAEQELTN